VDEKPTEQMSDMPNTPQMPAMTPDDVTKLFTRADGTFLSARWGRAIVPIVFGVSDETLVVIKGAVEAVAVLANHKLAETDMELGANLMFFFFSRWDELLEVPSLGQMVVGLPDLVDRLTTANANQYRAFRFDADGTIKAAFVFVRMDAHLAAFPAEALALSQMAQVILLWSDTAFSQISPLADVGSTTILRPDIAAVIRAAYDPILPAVSRDATHAYRIAARTAVVQ
jgi:hypothetical protein